MSKTLFEQAIAEAKDVRKTALENAKLALEESMNSRLQNMFSSKLSEELNEDDDLEEDTKKVNESEELEDEELDDDDSSEEESDDDSSDTEADTEDSTEEISSEDEESVEDKNVSEMSVEELKDVIRDVVQSELAAEAAPVEDDTLNDVSDDFSNDLTNADVTGKEDMTPEEDEEDDEDDDNVNLEEVFAELDKINNGSENIKEVAKAKKTTIKRSTNNKTGAPGFKKVGNLDEAYRVINIQRKELKDLNLLNAKLIYVNSIFKGKNLNESQKLKVIEKFDKATNVQEAKLIFETLMDSPKVVKPIKKALKESLSFASKAAGVASKKPIVQVDESVKRFQELAGIIRK